MEILYGDLCLYLTNSRLRRFKEELLAKLVRGIKYLPCVDRLSYQNLPSLRYRCIRGDLIYAYKLTYHLLDMDPTLLLTFY